MQEPPNLKKDPVRIEHASLKRVVDSAYRSKCPVCPKGILLVARSTKTFRLLREDACISCGQRFIYTDKDIAGEIPEQEKDRPS